MTKLALVVAIIGLTACGRGADDTTDTAAGNVAPPPVTSPTDTARMDTTKMGDTTSRDTTPRP